MGSFNNFLENSLLNQVFGGQAYSAPATLYFALSKTTIAEDGSNTTEPVGNGYSRVAVTNNTVNFPTTSNGTKSNGTVITFPQCTGANWGVVVDFAIFDAASNGNMLAYGTLTNSKTVEVLDILSFGVGNLTITLN